jgi:hypothetical protein
MNAVVRDTAATVLHQESRKDVQEEASGESGMRQGDKELSLQGAAMSWKQEDIQ